MPNSKKSHPAAKAHPTKATKAAPAKKPAAHAKPAAHPAPSKAKPAAPKAPAPVAKASPASKHAPAPKPAPAAKPTATPARPATKPTAAPVRPAAKAPTTPPAAKSATDKATAKADSLRARILERRTAKPIAFTLDEVREIAKTNVGRPGEPNGGETKSTNGKTRSASSEIEAKLSKAAQPNHIKPASLADILGYNPAKQAAPGVLDPEQVDPKFQRYYKLLIELRDHVVNGLNTHTEETLKRSAKEDSGDLSGYAQHMADAGTDTFDRDFALSLVSNEQEALAEIDAAIVRIQGGTYGVCELTGKPISKERLLAVPFARYSVESQAEVERTKRRSANRAGLFGEGEEGGKIEDDGGGGDE